MQQSLSDSVPQANDCEQLFLLFFFLLYGLATHTTATFVQADNLLDSTVITHDHIEGAWQCAAVANLSCESFCNLIGTARTQPPEAHGLTPPIGHWDISSSCRDPGIPCAIPISLDRCIHTMLRTLGNHMGYLTVLKGLGTENHDKGY